MECLRCKATNRDDARFCGQCGMALDVVASDAHDSERKPVSVLFADICGSTQLISGLDPEHAWSLLDPILQAMMAAAKTYGGTVTQIQGDGIVALIGAPIAQEDHAVRACYAALRMHQTVDQLSLPGYDGPPIRLHIGIATGEALVGMIGAELNRGYNAIGEVIHIAARLQNQAGPGQTLCTGETARQAAGFVASRELGVTTIRGVGRPVDIIELLGVSHAPMRFHATAARGLSSFSGRARELAILREAVGRMVVGHGSTVALVGEAGIGKSRLVWELTRSPELQACKILEAGGAFYATNSPYHPIIDLLRRHFEVDPLDSVAGNIRRVRGRLAESGIGPDSRRALLALLGLNEADDAWAALDPPRRRAAIESAVIEWLLGLAERMPVVLVVEDLHWVDHETHEVLRQLATRITTARVFLLVDYRPDHDAMWSQTTQTKIKIEPLPVDAMADLIDHVLGVDESVAPLRSDLLARVAGNPFFLEETARALAESGRLVGERGGYRLLPVAEPLQVPSSIRAVIGARIDRLAPQEKRLMQAAAVIGNSFAVADLSAMFDGLAPEAIHRSMRRLADAGLIEESALYPEPTWTFRHALTREVAYDALPQSRRRQDHARVVTAIEAQHGQRIAEQAETLVYHAALGEMWGRLARYARLAGQRAAAQSAYRSAARYFEQAIVGFGNLPQDETVAVDSIETMFELRSALYPLGEIARDLTHLRRAETLARGLRDRRLLAWTSTYIARDLALLGHPDEALTAGQAAQALAEAIDDIDLRVLSRASIGQSYYALGNYAHSARTLQAVLDTIAGTDPMRRFGLPLPGHVIFRCWLIWALSRLGETEAADAAMAELMPIAEACDQPLALTIATYSCGLALVNRDDLARGIVCLEKALSLCRQWELTAWFTNVASCLGHAYSRSGRCDEGLDLLRQAIERSQTLGLMVSHAIEVAWYAEACLEAGRFDEAARQARTAIGLGQQYNERGNEAYARWVAAEAASRMSAATAGLLVQARTARQLAEDCGMRPLLARCDRLIAALQPVSGSITAA